VLSTVFLKKGKNVERTKYSFGFLLRVKVKYIKHYLAISYIIGAVLFIIGSYLFVNGDF